MKRLLGLVLTSVIICSCVACNQNIEVLDGEQVSSGMESVSEEVEYAYVPEYIDLDFDLEVGEYMNGISMQNGIVIGIVQGFDFETEEAKPSIYTYDILGAKTEKIPLICSNKEAAIRKVYQTTEGNWEVLFSNYSYNEETGEMSNSYEAWIFDQHGIELSYEVMDTKEDNIEEIWTDKYHTDTDEEVADFDWLEIDVVASEIQDACKLEDGTIAAIYQEYITMEMGLIVVKKVPSSEVPIRKELVLATLELGFGTEHDIVDFNRKNTEYQIVIKDDYEDVTALYMDFISDNPPDLIELGSYSLNVDMLAKKGALEEITPYLEQAGYKQTDFISSILEVCKVEQGLYYVPQPFIIQTMFADADLVGSKMGWTFLEAYDIMKNLSSDMELNRYFTKTNAMAFMLANTLDQFIEEDANHAMFDSEEFKALLELSNLYPEEYVQDEDASNNEDAIRRGELLLYDGWIHDVKDIARVFDVFGDDAFTAIGIPGVEGCGAILSYMKAPVAISASSDYKDVAAEFIISALEPLDEAVYNMYGSRSPYGFPILQEEFDTLVQEELLLENINKQEVDLLMEFVNHTTMVSNYSYNELGVMAIEEATSYFSGDKSIDEVAELIQNRANLYLAEQG